MDIKSVSINNSEMEYIEFWNWEKVLIIIPWLSIKSILINPEAIESAFSDFINDYKIYLIDRLKKVPENYSIEEMVEDTYKTIKKIWIETCNIFWASQGWMIAQCIAINHPDLIEKLILWSTTPKVEKKSELIISRRIDLAKNNKIEELNKTMASDIYSEETLKQFWEIILNMNKDVSDEELQKFIILAESIKDFNIEDKLQNIKCKTLAISSKKDKIFWKEWAEIIAEKTNGKLYIYEDYSHAVYDEAPDFRTKMLEFLKE